MHRRWVLAAVGAGLAVAGAVALRTSQTAPPARVEPPSGATLTAEQVRELFAGNTAVTQTLKGGQPTGREFKTYHDPDGQVRLIDPTGRRAAGTWFVDPLGRYCIRMEGRAKTKCDVVVREGDAYLRLRDGEQRARTTVEEGNPLNL
jgi:hypothetical protein